MLSHRILQICPAPHEIVFARDLLDRRGAAAVRQFASDPKALTPA